MVLEMVLRIIDWFEYDIHFLFVLLDEVDMSDLSIKHINE